MKPHEAIEEAYRTLAARGYFTLPDLSALVTVTLSANGFVIVPRAVLVPRLSAATRQLVSDHAEAASSFSNKSDRKLATGLRLLLEQEERMSAALNGEFPEGERP